MGRQMKNKHNMNRRDFLTNCALLSASGVAAPLASLSALTLSNAALAQSATRPTEYRAMVCVYLSGGNDLNMMVPLDDYDNYQNVRGDLALDRGDLLPITSGSGASAQSFGLHPSCTGLQELYNSKKLAFVANTGAILQPATVANYRQAGVAPAQLFSHNSQKTFVNAGIPFDGRPINGWAGRIADLYAQTSATPLNLTLGGTNLWQRGALTSSYSLTSDFISKANLFDRTSTNDVIRKRGEFIQSMNGVESSHLLTNEYGRLSQRALDLSEALSGRQGQGAVTLQTQFSSGSSGTSFRHVAELINAREALGMQQQIFYVDIGGWDQHDDLLTQHSNSLNGLNNSLLAFQSALEEMGLQDNVVTFTNHDFGRTLGSNGDGSDHAWGGHQLIMGGSGGSAGIVKGGEVYGTHPIFSPDDPQYIDFRGVLVPSTSTDQLSATIAQWFGDFNEQQLVELFPNLANFNEKTLSFMS